MNLIELPGVESDPPVYVSPESVVGIEALSARTSRLTLQNGRYFDVGATASEAMALLNESSGSKLPDQVQTRDTLFWRVDARHLVEATDADSGATIRGLWRNTVPSMDAEKSAGYRLMLEIDGKITPVYVDIDTSIAIIEEAS